MGQRVKLVALLGTARIPVQIDVGFGDVVTPEAKEIEYPTLRRRPSNVGVRTYRKRCHRA